MRILLVVLLAAYCAAAAAQLRTIPDNAQTGTLRHVVAMQVEMNGQAAQLAPGAQIRDAGNLLVLPQSLQERVMVRYLTNDLGQIYRVWILSDAEKAALPQPAFSFPR